MLIVSLQHSVILPQPKCQKPLNWFPVMLKCTVWGLFFSSAATSYGSLSGCRPGRWAGGGSPGWGWRLCGPSPFWWPPPGSGFAWSSGRPAPASLNGSPPRCSGPTLSLDTHKRWSFSLIFMHLLTNISSTICQIELLPSSRGGGGHLWPNLRLWGLCGWTRLRDRSWRSCQMWGSRGPRCRGRWCSSLCSTPLRHATCSGHSWGCAWFRV